MAFDASATSVRGVPETRIMTARSPGGRRAAQAIKLSPANHLKKDNIAGSHGCGLALHGEPKRRPVKSHT
jgi:ribosomal protein L34E